MKWVLFGTLVFLNILDILSTHIGWSLGIGEANPILQTSSLTQIMVMKAIVLTIMGITIYFAKKPRDVISAQVLTLIGVVVYAIVVGVNVGGILVWVQVQ